MNAHHDPLRAPCPPTIDLSHQLLLDLLPYGAAWPRAQDSNIWRYWRGPAAGLDLVMQQVCDLLREFNPCTAQDTLPEWAEALGLLDGDCTVDYCIDTQSTAVQAEICARARLVFAGGEFDPMALAADFGFDLVEVEVGELEMDCGQIGCAMIGGSASMQVMEADCAEIECAHLGASTVCTLGACQPTRYFQFTNLPPAQEFEIGCSQVGQPLCYIPGMESFLCLVEKYRRASVSYTFL